MSKLKLNVLIVEDEIIIAMNIKSMLDSFGHNVIGITNSGKEAIKRVEKSKPDIVLIDIKLKGDISGIEVAREINKNFDIPLIYITAYSDESTLSKVKNTNPYGYLLKPVNSNRLNTVIEIIYNRFLYDKKIKDSEQRYHGIVENLPLLICRFLPINGFITYVNSTYCKYFGKTEVELMGRSFFDMIPEHYRESVKANIGSMSKEKPIISYEHVISTGDGYRWQRWISHVVFDENHNIIENQAIGEDITGRKLAEREIEEKTSELDKRIREMECLYGISRIVEKHRDSIGDIMSKIVDIIPLAMKYPDTTCAKIDYRDMTFKTDNYKETVWNIKDDIFVHNKLSGTLEVCYLGEKDTIEDVFTEEERIFVTAVSWRIGEIIENFNAQKELKRLERETISINIAERQMIGQELHDGLGQILTGISFLIKTVEKKVRGMSLGEIKEIGEVEGLIKEATIFCRNLSRGLSPVDIKNEGFLRAIEQLANETRDLYNIGCELSAGGITEIKDSFDATQLFYIVREAVTNAVKHSGASNVFITINADESGLMISVRDDGVGMGSDEEANGLGMGIMKYRSDLIGSEFSVKNEDKGLVVSVRIPDGTD